MSGLPQRWLLATDGSKYATQSVQYAARLYKFIDPKPSVLIMTVIPDPRNRRDKDNEQSKDKSKHVLREAKAFFEAEAGIADTVSTFVAIGEPREVIVETAKKAEIDHLIMGGGDYQWKITDLLSGGVTNYILHHLNCVITIIK
jgi:nucleotide-binding universal stress UspA family protein